MPLETQPDSVTRLLAVLQRPVLVVGRFVIGIKPEGQQPSELLFALTIVPLAIAICKTKATVARPSES
jgi:hypothetical protein